MKTTILIISLIAAGCTTTNYSDSAGRKFRRVSLFQKVRGDLLYHTNGTLEIRGYANDGGNESLRAIAAGAAEGAVKGMKGMKGN